MATCPRCWEYLAEGHRCHGRWRPLFVLGVLVAFGSLAGALAQIVAGGRQVPLIGTLAGGILAFVLYEVIQTFVAERDIQLRTVRWFERRRGFHPFSLFALRRQEERHQRSWRLGLIGRGRRGQARLLEQLLEQDVREAELDRLCQVALQEAGRLTGASYHTMSEPVLMPGSVPTIEWTVVAPAGLVAISKEWPETAEFEEMADALTALLVKAGKKSVT